MAQKFDYAIHGAKIPLWQYQRMDHTNFGSLFVRGESEEEEDNDFFLSPRMAFKLFHSARYLADVMDDVPEIYGAAASHPRVCKIFFRKKRWVDSYIECYRRIAARLAKVELL